MKHAVVIAWLAAELAKLPASRVPEETREEYVGRVHAIATAIVEEAAPFANGRGWTLTELAASAGVIWHGETLFDRRIHAGEGHPVWHQDHGLARCGMQLHRSGIVPQEVWERMVGLGKDQTHLCAQYGLRVVVAQAQQCGVYVGQRADRNRVAKMLASYASGGRCVPGDRDWQRADRWLKIMATRPDHEKKVMPGYRRVGPAEMPPEVHESALSMLDKIKRSRETGRGLPPVGSWQPALADNSRFVLRVEKHAEGKVGVSVFVKE